MRPRHIHIGHDYFGAGNVGDDLMVAGFLQALAARGENVRLTCCCRHDATSQQKRFPQIEWLPRTQSVRAEMVNACDVWLGLGDSPFQSEVSTWFLDHLGQEAALCRQYDKPMYFLGVGVNDEKALTYPKTHRVVSQAKRIWTRDPASARQLALITPHHKIKSGADLAHIYLARQAFAPPVPDSIGWILHFEKRAAFSPRALQETVDLYPHHQMWWLAQEVRVIPGSELETWARLSPGLRARFQLRQPDYQDGTMEDLVAAWSVPETLVTSRYHGALTGAWLGARVLAVTRNAKVQGAAEQMGVVSIPSLLDAQEVRAGVASAQPVPRATLTGLADLATSCVEDFLRVSARARWRKLFTSGSR